MKATIAIWIFFISSFACADTIERIQLIGASFDGKRIAIIRSYFGPSSYAPSVSLQVLEAGSAELLLEDGASAFQGDESVLSNLRDAVVQRNSQKLLQLNLSNRFTQESVNAYGLNSGNQVLVEADVFQSGAIARYTIVETESRKSKCTSSEKRAVAFQFCAMYEGRPTGCELLEPFPSDGLGCYAVHDISYSRVIRIGSYLWFHFFVNTEPLTGLFFRSQIIHAERVP